MISIAIGTYNRAKSLERTLRCLKNLRPADRFEIVVVNNKSQDNTRQVVQRFLSGLPTVRYFYEPELGFSNALNRSIREARGEIISFIDDDETVSDNWVESVLKAFENPETDVIFTRLYVLDDRNSVISDSDERRFPKRDYGPEPIVVTPDNCRKMMFGTGISSYRLSVLRRMGTFRTDRGRKGNRMFAGEDTDMYEAYVQQGRRVLYWPDAIVYHHIDAHRLSWKGSLQRAFDFGVNATMSEPLPRKKHLLGVPVYELKNSALAVMRLAFALPQGRAAAWKGLDSVVNHMGSIQGFSARWLARAARPDKIPGG